ncbi:His Kinase A (phospho-acceptor) domain-containing protein [Natronoarchaeum philippinense]|uniref:histidine kinase n=1 Tax=Natronoarchaeum philippinense TaxID=558529 RepID=A0A285NBW7_NATPI|nr:hybrid sensor histidine kinase/response regulator [Natronoarchaeum philippinense]SNZ06994.1 His Kinase A (phospho-acceptor) domain-containing protein [Natronoarchaeum philippinense]
MRETVTVLHVDDDEEFTALTAEYLAMEDDTLDVTTFHDPDAAIERLAGGGVDCVVTDFDMGSEDGIELVERVRATDPDVPCLLFTARNDGALVERAIEAGATEYLQKGRPAQFTLLAHRIHTAVAVHAADGAALHGATDGGADGAAAGFTGDTAVPGGPPASAETPHRAASRGAGRPPDERIEEVASVVSHDLQNPLTIARGYLERARRDGDDEYFEHADEALDEIAQLSDGVVTLARLGKRVERFEPVDIESVVRSRWQDLDAPAASLTADDLGPVAGEYSRISDLFERLLDNAVRHGADEDGSVAVTVGSTADGLYVADDGPGVPADRREQVLEAGYSSEQGRPGLGLSIARAIAEAHGWELSLAESDAGGLRIEIDGVRFEYTN